jgi:ribosomal protein S18 acetylase RimI-like enzyme
MIIRKAALDDYAIVNPILVEVEHLHVEIEPEIFRSIENYDLAHYNDLVTSKKSVVLIAESEGGQVLGALIALVSEWPAFEVYHGGEYVMVKELSIAPSAKGMGIGKALMAAAEDWARLQGIGQIQLSVWARNRQAIGFYEALGYSPYIHTYQKKIR